MLEVNQPLELASSDTTDVTRSCGTSRVVPGLKTCTHSQAAEERLFGLPDSIRRPRAAITVPLFICITQASKLGACDRERPLAQGFDVTEVDTFWMVCSVQKSQEGLGLLFS